MADPEAVDGFILILAAKRARRKRMTAAVLMFQPVTLRWVAMWTALVASASCHRPRGGTQRDATPPGGSIVAETLVDEARRSILASRADETIFPGGIPQETLVAAESLLGGNAASGFGQSRREWREAQSLEQRTILREASAQATFAGEFIADEGEQSEYL